MNNALIWAWEIWDQIYERCTRLEYIDRHNNIFRIVLLTYRGNPLTTGDGKIINHGDPIIKLHIHNCRLARKFSGVTSDVKLGLLLRKEILHSLPALACYVKQNPACQHVKGIVGTTMLYRGARGLGFSVADVPDTTFYRYKNWYLKLMMSLMHPEGRNRIKKNTQHLKLKRVYMSTDELLDRYLQEE
ncbi:MAG: hypothetical protein H0Z33_00795 [Bacillaceae bacterium]|nr:hypothetical protein [Bacillaceae bacterium]